MRSPNATSRSSPLTLGRRDWPWIQITCARTHEGLVEILDGLEQNTTIRDLFIRPVEPCLFLAAHWQRDADGGPVPPQTKRELGQSITNWDYELKEGIRIELFYNNHPEQCTRVSILSSWGACMHAIYRAVLFPLIIHRSH